MKELRFIAIEGVIGAGKTSLAKILADKVDRLQQDYNFLTEKMSSKENFDQVKHLFSRQEVRDDYKAFKESFSDSPEFNYIGINGSFMNYNDFFNTAKNG